MKNKLTLLLLGISLAASAQIKVLSGDFKNLKDVSSYNVVFDYDGVRVDKSSEAEFLADRMGKRSEKNAARFKEGWFADRDSRYEPKFVESFNKRFDGKVKAAENQATATHTMKITTKWIHPGFNVGVMHNSALVNYLITVVDNSNPTAPLVTFECNRMSGKGIFVGFGFLDYNSGYRISESYAKLAKVLSGHMKKKFREKNS